MHSAGNRFHDFTADSEFVFPGSPVLWVMVKPLQQLGTLRCGGCSALLRCSVAGCAAACSCVWLQAGHESNTV